MSNNAGLISRLLTYYRILLDNYLEINNATIQLIPLIKILIQALYSLAEDLRKYISLDNPEREKIFDLQYHPHLSKKNHARFVEISQHTENFSKKLETFSEQFIPYYENLKPLIPELNALRKELLFINEFTLGEYVLNSPIKIQSILQMPFRRKDYLFEVLLIAQNVKDLLEDLYFLEREYQFLESVDIHLRVDYPYLVSTHSMQPGFTNELKNSLENSKRQTEELNLKMNLIKNQVLQAQQTLKAQEFKAVLEHEQQLIEHLKNMPIEQPQALLNNKPAFNPQPKLQLGGVGGKATDSE